jgi:hypothetical protein
MMVNWNLVENSEFYLPKFGPNEGKYHDDSLAAYENLVHLNDENLIHEIQFGNSYFISNKNKIKVQNSYLLTKVRERLLEKF